MMLNNVLSNVDFIEYLITIFAFELSPGIAFIIVIRNTIISKSLVCGLYTAFAIAMSDLFFCMISFFGLLEINHLNSKLFSYIKIISLIYIVYIAIKMIFTKTSSLQNNDIFHKKIKIKPFKIIKETIVLTFNPATIMIYISIMIQFIKPEFEIHYKIFLIFCIAIVCFISFSLLAIISSTKFISKIITKFDNSILDKIAGIVLLLMSLKAYFSNLNCFNSL